MIYIIYDISLQDSRNELEANDLILNPPGLLRISRGLLTFITFLNRDLALQ